MPYGSEILRYINWQEHKGHSALKTIFIPISLEKKWNYYSLSTVEPLPQYETEKSITEMYEK